MATPTSSSSSSSFDPPVPVVFLPFARFDPANPSEELPLSVGRPVWVINREESPDWWYGRDAEDGREVCMCVYVRVGVVVWVDLTGRWCWLGLID